LSNLQTVELDTEMLDGIGSFCLRSKKNSVGYINKKNWLHEQFEEGLRYIQLMEGKKPIGFIEYTDSQYSSRVVHADDYLVVHCLWVSEPGKGYGAKLINKCLEDAKVLSKKGVAVVTNSDTSWTASKDIFLKHQFQQVDSAPLHFELLVYRFDSNSDLPYFPTNWEERTKRFQKLTILRTFQCPYVEVATENILAGANKLGLDVQIIDFKDRNELMELSPTPYGIFSVIYKGQLLSFHRLTIHTVIKRLKELT
jgi:hypothetical protein